MKNINDLKKGAEIKGKICGFGKDIIFFDIGNYPLPCAAYLDETGLCWYDDDRTKLPDMFSAETEYTLTVDYVSFNHIWVFMKETPYAGYEKEHPPGSVVTGKICLVNEIIILVKLADFIYARLCPCLEGLNTDDYLPGTCLPFRIEQYAERRIIIKPLRHEQ